ncbi:VOC family protein [Microlunatus elymi]|uniref:VOC family protein n=1 Tax=Microlunatus elymi TaxID=2596828 RepID=A0A516PY15_9ACTN|nr:VOC family protein [Microlunatus elymi]QDP96069.1 VOC family protein [Microlunatus elymi]
MATQLNPYLSFRDNARSAMEFYQSVFGGDLTVSTFGEFHASEEVDEQDKVMHARLEAPNGLVLMAADTPKQMELASGSNISVSLSGDDDSELRGYWDKLSDGGQVAMGLEAAPWGDVFGMCTDRYGTQWLVNITGQPS